MFTLTMPTSFLWVKKIYLYLTLTIFLKTIMQFQGTATFARPRFVWPTYVRPNICPTAMFFWPAICPTCHLSDLPFVRPAICPTCHLSEGLNRIGWNRLWVDGSRGLGAFQLGDESTDFDGLGAGVWGWNLQLGDEIQVGFGDESTPVRLVRSG